jgi:uncharacterized membrane protein YdjX (TVP38/TMEM64 family)
MAQPKVDTKPLAKETQHLLSTEKELENEIESHSQKSHKKDFIWVGVLFAIGASIFFVLYHTVPSAENVTFTWKIPRNIEDLRELAGVAQAYYHSNPTYVTVLYVYLYIFLQTFGVPGPAILGIIGGALFGPIRGFILANFCATMGAILCYYLSLVIGKSIILKYFPGLLKKFNKFMNEHEDNLVWYMLFLRVTPLLPNWFINYASPIVGMPFKLFFIGSFLGLLPNSFILVRTGVLIHEVSEFGLNLKAFLFLGGLALLMLVPTLLSKKVKKNFEASPDKVKTEKPKKE